MNEVSNLSYFIIDKFKTNPLVNTVTFEKTSEMDYNKENIYPLVNVDVVSSDILGAVIEITYTLSILEARDIEPLLNNNKLFGSNLIDNLNECHTIAVKFINEIANQDNNINAELIRTTSIAFLKLWKGSLDGTQFTIVLEVPNTISGC